MGKKKGRMLIGFTIVRTWPQHGLSKTPPRPDEIVERWEDPSPEREAALRKNVSRRNGARFYEEGMAPCNYELRNLYEDEA